jgi:hypothetical protein
MSSPSNSCPQAGQVKVSLQSTISGLLGASRTSWLRSVVAFAAGLILVALLCRRLDLRTIVAVAKRASLPLLGLSVAALCAFYFLRAVRWAIILKRKVGFVALFTYSSIGYLISSVAPMQAGELVKPALVRARHGLPYFATAASVAVERLLDVATLVLLGVTGIIALPGHALGPAWVAASLKAGGLLCALGFLMLALSSRWAGGVLHVVSRTFSLLHLPPRINDQIVVILRVFLRGAGGALSPLNLFCALLCSIALWGANAASVAIIFWAVNGRVPSIPALLVGFAVLSIGLAIPLSPGYIGQYEGLWLLVFASLHVAPGSDVLAVGLLCHGLILLTIAFFGLLSLGFLRLPNRAESSTGENPRLLP